MDSNRQNPMDAAERWKIARDWVDAHDCWNDVHDISVRGYDEPRMWIGPDRFKKLFAGRSVIVNETREGNFYSIRDGSVFVCAFDGVPKAQPVEMVL